MARVDSLPVVRVAPPGVLLNCVEKLLPAAVDFFEPRVLPPNDEPPELPLDLFDLTKTANIIIFIFKHHLFT